MSPVNNKNSSLYFSAAVFLILLNIAIFIYANSFSLRWVHNETLYHQFVWAAEGKDLTSLKSGLSPNDFLKPFMSVYVDGAYRTRQISYLAEMLSFKFWEYFSTGYIRNYTLIGIHLLNTFLAWVLVFSLTKKKWAAWVASCFLLNSGIALATLAFPFRNAKLLVMTFFLLAWIVVIRARPKFCEAKMSRIALFFLLAFLAAFTDEIAFSIFPIIFIYLYFRDGRGGLLSRRLLIPGLITGMVFAVSAIGFLAIAKRYGSIDQMNAFKDLFRTWGSCYAGGFFIRDFFKAFFAFFLRRDFGYWDLTPLGMLAALSFFLLIVHMARYSSPQYRRLSLAIGAVLLIKNLILVHNGGYHKFIMPEGTVFPSLLFFSYYYSYAEAVVLGIVMGLLMDLGASQGRRVVFYLCLAAVIASSNAVHLKQGLGNALEFHKWHKPGKIAGFDDVTALRKVIKDERYWPLYLSFPSINQSLLDGKDLSEMLPYYVKTILIMFLKDIEEGRAVVSLKNIKPRAGFRSDEELVNADYFYDVARRALIDLKAIREEKGKEGLKSFRISPGERERTLSFNLTPDIRSFMFFVKGKARIRYGLNQGPPVSVKQSFGYSYQVFPGDIRQPVKGTPYQLNIEIAPEDINQSVSVVGPLFSSESMSRKVQILK